MTIDGRTFRMRRLVHATLTAAVFTSIAVGGPSFEEPDPSNKLSDTDVASITHMAEVYDRLSRQDIAGWGHSPSLAAALAEMRRIDQEVREKWREVRDVDRAEEDEWQQRYPSIEVSDMRLGAWPRDGLEAGVELVRAVEKSDIPALIEAFASKPAEIEPWPRDVRPTTAMLDRSKGLRGSRDLANVWMARMRMAAVEERQADAASRFEELIAITAAGRARLTFRERHVAELSAAIITAELRHEIFEGLHDARSLERCAAALERWNAGPDIEKTLQVERTFCAVFIEEYQRKLPTPVMVRPEDIERELDAAVEQGRQAAREPIQFKGFGDRQLDAMLAQMGQLMRNPPAADEMLDVVAQSFRGMAIWTVPMLVNVRATQIMIALEQHRLANGKYPRSIGDLVPQWLRDEPMDPLTARPFVYQLTPGEAAPYILYIPGVDGVDNNGRTDPERPDRAMTRGDVGWDYVLNQRRSEPRRPKGEKPPGS